MVLDLDESTLADAFGERRDQVGLRFDDLRIGCLRELELSERLLELAANAVERGVRVGSDHRADEFQCQPDRARLERRQARGEPERVAVQLLVDVHAVALECGVDRVTAAPEVDEVQQLQVLFQLFLRDVEAFDDLARGDHGVVRFATGGEQVREERLEDGKAFRDDRAGRPFARGFHTGHR